jgi:hypothetical protein
MPKEFARPDQSAVFAGGAGAFLAGLGAGGLGAAAGCVASTGGSLAGSAPIELAKKLQWSELLISYLGIRRIPFAERWLTALGHKNL